MFALSCDPIFRSEKEVTEELQKLIVEPLQDNSEIVIEKLSRGFCHMRTFFIAPMCCGC